MCSSTPSSCSRACALWTHPLVLVPRRSCARAHLLAWHRYSNVPVSGCQPMSNPSTLTATATVASVAGILQVQFVDVLTSAFIGLLGELSGLVTGPVGFRV